MAKDSRGLRPCDCHDRVTVRELNEQGVSFGFTDLTVAPPFVIFDMGYVTVKIPQSHFERFAKWYLEPQRKEPQE